MSEENLSQNDEYKCTPPPNRKIRNPFDKVLIGKLHMPICSPGMCKIYKRQADGSFRWEIDQACVLIPKDIVACNSQFAPTPDPALEQIAEEATERFFSQEMVMPSPLDSSKNIRLLQISHSDSIHIHTEVNSEKVTRDVSSQTVLTLPPILPPEIESILQTFSTFTQDQNYSGEYEITANGSLRRKLFFEEHSDMEHNDSEQTDEECHNERRPPSSVEHHSPVNFSPDLSRDLVTKGMKRTFGTPISKPQAQGYKLGYRNKILESVDMGEPCFSPIVFQTPQRMEQGSGTSSSLASMSISPVTKTISSDEEKNNFSSPESDAIATCLDCVSENRSEKSKGNCFCKSTPNKSLLCRSVSLRGSSRRSSSLSGKRSASMSSLTRNRSVQKLDFSMDMSIDDSMHDDRSQDLSLRCHSTLAGSDSSSSPRKEQVWAMEDEASMHKLVKTVIPNEGHNVLASYSKIINVNKTNVFNDTPIKAKTTNLLRTHVINKIRTTQYVSPVNMSLDNSMDSVSDNPLSLEDKKIDFNNVDFKFLTTNADYNGDMTKVADCTTGESLKRIDSGFNENTFYTNASGYYESAIKPSELTVYNASKCNNTKGALKEISNINWMRLDSGFKDETSTDSDQFYPTGENCKKLSTCEVFAHNVQNKENVTTDDFDRFIFQASNKSEVMSMSDVFTDEITFNCNFSSTPSKNKARNENS